jgi:hypothetical protein
MPPPSRKATGVRHSQTHAVPAFAARATAPDTILAPVGADGFYKPSEDTLPWFIADTTGANLLSGSRMQKTIAVAFEGPGAQRALDEFLAIAGIVGEAQPVQPVDPDRVARDGGVLAAIGAIVGLVGGIAPIVSAIIDWRAKWKSAHQSQRLSVVIEDARGNRISLDHATPEQIAAVLQTLQA